MSVSKGNGTKKPVNARPSGNEDAIVEKKPSSAMSEEKAEIASITEMVVHKEPETALWTGVGTSGIGIPVEEISDEVLKDIYPNEKAIFGYSAKEGTAYGKMDFTDEEEVLLNREIRIDYINDTPNVQAKIDEMTRMGKSKKEIATVAVDMRNQSKVAARSKMKPESVKELEARNIKKYNNPIGPDAQWSFDKEKNRAMKAGVEKSDNEIWDLVIAGAMRKDEVANTLLGIRH